MCTVICFDVINKLMKKQMINQLSPGTISTYYSLPPYIVLYTHTHPPTQQHHFILGCPVNFPIFCQLF